MRGRAGRRPAVVKPPVRPAEPFRPSVEPDPARKPDAVFAAQVRRLRWRHAVWVPAALRVIHKKQTAVLVAAASVGAASVGLSHLVYRQPAHDPALRQVANVPSQPKLWAAVALPTTIPGTTASGPGVVPVLSTKATTTTSPSAPPVAVPTTVPPVTVVTVTVPKVTLPTVTILNVTVSVTVPQVTVAVTVPNVTLPKVTVPAVTVPPVTVPPITVPTTLPAVPKL